MTFAPALLVIALDQASAGSGALAQWKLAGRFVEQQAVEDARCAATLDDLCRALGVEQEGFLEIREGELRYRGDAECWDLPFRAEAVDGDLAMGAFERPEPDGSTPTTPCAGESCTGRGVQISRDGDTLKLRPTETLGNLETLGACGAPVRLEVAVKTGGLWTRFVPEERLTSAATEQATRLGVNLRRCDYKTEPGVGPVRPCVVTGGEILLKLTEISTEHCPDEPVIRMRVENVSSAALSTSVSVERLGDGGMSWDEYWVDVLGTDPFAKAVLHARIAKGGSLDIRWRPRVASHLRGLAVGTYRIVATTTPQLDGARPARSILGGFVVRSGPGCTKSPRTRSTHSERRRSDHIRRIRAAGDRRGAGGAPRMAHGVAFPISLRGLQVEAPGIESRSLGARWALGWPISGHRGRSG